MGTSKNLVFYGLNPSPFSGREGYKEFLETPIYESMNVLQNSIDFINLLYLNIDNASGYPGHKT